MKKGIWDVLANLLNDDESAISHRSIDYKKNKNKNMMHQKLKRLKKRKLGKKKKKEN